MSHNCPHYICPCRQEIFDDAIEVLTSIVKDIQDYRDKLPAKDRGKFIKKTYPLEFAWGVIERARKR